ncbi:MAG: hypothetical protein KAG18_06050, partial [Sinobacterium sp.]|nr:hypothetical protein [Sinobacterium sp.]
MKTMYAILLFLFTGTAAAVFNQYYVHGSFSLMYVIVIFFLTLNLLINYWELILWYKKDLITEKSDKLYAEHKDDKNLPMFTFLQSKMGFSKVFSADHWADAWIGYSMFDRSYSNHKS